MFMAQKRDKDSLQCFLSLSVRVTVVVTLSDKESKQCYDAGTHCTVYSSRSCSDRFVFGEDNAYFLDQIS